jgi:uncharacterized protein (DUF4415 family)
MRGRLRHMVRKDNDAGSQPNDENPEWTTEEIAHASPALDVIGDIFGVSIAETLRRGRGRPAKLDSKINQTLRLDRDVLDAYRQLGGGWQVRMNDVLREHMPRPHQ